MPLGTENDPDRQPQIVQKLQGLVEPGDHWLVLGTKEQVLVIDWPVTGRSALQDDDPEFYGFLLRLNARIGNTPSRSAGGVMFALTLAACFWIHLQIPHFGFWWVYAFIPVFMLFVSNHLDNWFAARIYETLRTHLRDEMELRGYQQDTLLAAIAGDTELARLSWFVQLDTQLATTFER